ncbi:unnamed protein product, partial [marine sediment metagenome]
DADEFRGNGKLRQSTININPAKEEQDLYFVSLGRYE